MFVLDEYENLDDCDFQVRPKSSFELGAILTELFYQDAWTVATSAPFLSVLAQINGLHLELLHPSPERHARQSPVHGAQLFAYAIGSLTADSMDLDDGVSALLEKIWREVIFVVRPPSIPPSSSTTLLKGGLVAGHKRSEKGMGFEHR